MPQLALFTAFLAGGFIERWSPRSQGRLEPHCWCDCDCSEGQRFGSLALFILGAIVALGGRSFLRFLGGLRLHRWVSAEQPAGAATLEGPRVQPLTRAAHGR